MTEKTPPHDRKDREHEGSVEIAREILHTLNRHIARLMPKVEGSSKIATEIGNVPFGARNVTVERARQPLEISSLRFPEGKSKALIGRNGSGKTTLIDAIMSRDGAYLDTHMARGAIITGKSLHARDHFLVSRLDQEEGFGEFHEKDFAGPGCHRRFFGCFCAIFGDRLWCVGRLAGKRQGS